MIIQALDRAYDMRVHQGQQLQLGILGPLDLQIFEQEATKFTRKAIIEDTDINCFEWLPGRTGNPEIMVGTTTGEVKQITFDNKTTKSQVHAPFQVERRFVCHNSNQGQCNTIQQNPLSKHLFAAGYDQGGKRDQSCLLVWDLNSSSEQSKIQPF